MTLIAPERYAISATRYYARSGIYRITVTVTDGRNVRRATATTDAQIEPAPRPDPSGQQRVHTVSAQSGHHPERSKRRAS
jgi:hypothetical protein